MAVPSVTLTQIDGALGVIPPQAGDTQVVIGPADSGALNTPVAFARNRDMVSYFTSGPLVECGGYQIDKTGRATIFIRSNATTAGASGTLVTTGWTGTSVVTIDAASACNDEYEFVFKIVNGGTRGEAGITYKYSLDGGRTWSAVLALGTAVTVTIPNSGGLKLAFAAGTMVANDQVTSRTSAPAEGNSDITSALASLAASSLDWDFVTFATPLTAAQIALVDTWCTAQWALGKHRKFMCSVRGPNVGETEAQYLTALTALVANTTTIYGAVCAGYAKTISAVSAKQYRRPVVWVAASRAASSLISSHGVNISEVALGPLPSDVVIHDANGNPDEHDEYLNPGLGDLKFLTLRSIPGLKGTFITKDVLMCPTGSDFNRWAYRGVLNDAADALRAFLVMRLEKAVRVNRATGYILEQDAVEIENGATAAMRDAVLTVPDASAVSFVLSRTDNLLSTSTLHGDARLVPLAYPDQIGITLGFDNPAARVVAV